MFWNKMGKYKVFRKCSKTEKIVKMLRNENTYNTNYTNIPISEYLLKKL